MDTKFVPLRDRVLVRRIGADETTPGGIVLPDMASEKPIRGMVVAVGEGRYDEAGKLIPMCVKVGHQILFGTYSGSEVKLDGVEYLVMNENDILGVILSSGA